MRRAQPRTGFTLIEMMVVVTLLALVAGALVPVIIRPYIAEYQVEVTNEMAAIEAAILGKPEKGNFGFLGDMGGISGNQPLTSLASTGNSSTPPGLQQLITQGMLPAAALGASLDTPPDPGIVVGWNGPYLWPHYPQPFTDPWGNFYLLELGTSFGSDSTHWRLRSTGPDRAAHTADDIVFPADGNPASGLPSQGTLLVDLWKTTGGGSVFAANQASFPSGSPEASTGSGVGEWPVTATDMGMAGWLVTLSPLSTPCNQSMVAGQSNVFFCPAVSFGNHHLQVKNKNATPNTVILDQDVIINTPSAYVRPFITLPGTATTLPGVSGATAASSLCEPPSGSTPPGTFCMSKNTDFPTLNGGSTLLTYFGTIAVSDATTECQIQAALDTATTGSTPVAIGKPVFVSGSTAPSGINFTLTVPVTFPAGPWKLYVATTAKTGSGTCSVASPYAANAIVLGHP